jgi:hypothetical protein
MAIGTLGGTIHYATGKGTVHIPLLMDDGSTCTVATEAFFATKLPHKLLSESALEKRKQLYIGPDKETGGRTFRRYSDDSVVGRATCTNGLYVIRLAPKPQYIAHASVQQLDINILHQRLGHVGKDVLRKVAKMGDFNLTGTLT